MLRQTMDFQSFLDPRMRDYSQQSATRLLYSQHNRKLTGMIVRNEHGRRETESGFLQGERHPVPQITKQFGHAIT